MLGIQSLEPKSNKVLAIICERGCWGQDPRLGAGIAPCKSHSPDSGTVILSVINITTTTVTPARVFAYPLAGTELGPLHESSL